MGLAYCHWFFLAQPERLIAAGDRITCPLLVLWGGRGFVGARYDVLDVWRDYALGVRGEPLDCGHFLPEERPVETLAALQAFLG